MEKGKKVIVLLLVIAILFSIISIAINLVTVGIEVPQPVSAKSVSGDSGSKVRLVVEGNAGGTG